MTEDEFIQLNYEHYSSLFPRRCSGCARLFVSLREYIQSTRPVGATISYDAELGDWQTERPLGAAALANCPCGSTVGLTTEGIPLEVIQRMLEWIKVQTEQRGITSAELLGYVREQVRKRALADPAQR